MKTLGRLFATLLVLLSTTTHASETVDGRYSFSLTTFDPSGKLGQVERATRAAALGTPVVAICRSSSILLASPQALPSKFMSDDGTARFSRITQEIAIAHSGLAADGRVVVAAAQRMAVEHAYTYEEEIPLQVFLQNLSLLFQEYTMKPASRPFGCTLLVAHVCSGGCRLYRVDPSGSVEDSSSCIIGSLQNNSKLLESLQELAAREENDDDVEELCQLLQQAIGKESSKLSFLQASLTSKGLQVHRQNSDGST